MSDLPPRHIDKPWIAKYQQGDGGLMFRVWKHGFSLFDNPPQYIGMRVWATKCGGGPGNNCIQVLGHLGPHWECSPELYASFEGAFAYLKTWDEA